MAFAFAKKNKNITKKQKKQKEQKKTIYLKKTGFAKKLKNLFSNKEYDENNFFDKMEELFIMYDVGVETTLSLINNFKEKIKKEQPKTENELKELLKDSLYNMLPCCAYKIKDGLNVLFILGVNGVGKTTSIAKLGHYFKNKLGKKVMFVACDTFRAAAIEQLNIWADRLSINIAKSKTGLDPGAVLHNAINKAYSKTFDVILVDTAGRFHTRHDLVAELSKLSRIIYKKANDAYIENLLVLDAMTGQNAFAQSEKFKEHININGVILTKFDSDAKGGIVLPLAHKLNMPVKFLGIGEQVEDIIPFDRELYINELLW